MFIETNSNSIVYIDPNNGYWNLMIYIPNSHTFDVAQNTEMVFEAGKLYGDFLLQTSNVLTRELGVTSILKATTQNKIPGKARTEGLSSLGPIHKSHRALPPDSSLTASGHFRQTA